MSRKSEEQEVGGTVGAAIYQEPAAPLNPQPEPEPAAKPEDDRAEPGGTVGAAIYQEPDEPVNPDEPEA